MALVQNLTLAGIAIMGIGALYSIKKIQDEIENSLNSNRSFSFPNEHTPVAESRDVDIQEAEYAPSLFYRGSVDEPTASEIPYAVSSRGGKTKRKRRLQKRSRRINKN